MFPKFINVALNKVHLLVPILILSSISFLSLISHYLDFSTIFFFSSLSSTLSFIIAFVTACSVFVIFRPFLSPSHLFPHFSPLILSSCPVSFVSNQIDVDGSPPSFDMHFSWRCSLWKLTFQSSDVTMWNIHSSSQSSWPTAFITGKTHCVYVYFEINDCQHEVFACLFIYTLQTNAIYKCYSWVNIVSVYSL